MSRRRRAPPDADVGGVPTRVYDGPVVSFNYPWLPWHSRAHESWKSPPAPGESDRQFANSLLLNGFALVASHVFNNSITDVMASASNRRFALSAATKLAMSVSAEDGYVKAEHKEIFYFGPRSASCDRSLGQRPWIHSAVRRHRNSAIELGEKLVSSLNRQVFKPPPPEAVEREPDRMSFLDDWYDERLSSQRYCCTLGQSVVSDFCYHASCPAEFHSNAHVDKGLLTIIQNPADVEVCVDGEWMIPYDPERHAGAVLVLVGYTLERASGGHFHAALHRVRNRGARCSTVTKLHLPPHLVIEPALLCSHFEQQDVDAASYCSFTSRTLLAEFRRNHASVNAPAMVASDESTALAPQRPAPRALRPRMPRRGADARVEDTITTMTDLSRDTIETILCAATVQTLGRLASSCTMLRDCVAAADSTVWVPAAERSRIDWNLALDRIDRGAPSYGRFQEPGVAPQDAASLLASVANKWPEILRRELTDDDMHANTRIICYLVPKTAYEIFFILTFETMMQKLMTAFCNRQGVAMSSVRFLFDGSRISPNQTPAELEFEEGEVIDILVEQMGD